jgi:hypothetical protein
MKLHLWNFAPGRSSMCNTALYTERMTADAGKATCAKCYLNHLLRLTQAKSV